jgi:drug/metabolite transporter, DME family
MRAVTGSGVTAVLLAALLWGTTGTAAAMAPGVGALAIGAAAMGIGGLLQAGVAARLLHAHRAELVAHRRIVVLSAVAVAVFPLAFYSSMRLAGVAVGTVVTIGSAPPAAALLERHLERISLSRRWALGTAVGVVGVLALASAHPGAGAATSPGSQPGWAPLVGIALALLGGLTYAVYSWGAGRVIRHGVPSRAVMGAVFGLGGVLLLPVLLVTGGPILGSGTNLAVALYLAVVPMFLGYLLFGRGLARVSASTATTVSLAEPAAAAVIAFLVLHERLTPAGWLGLGLLFASLLITTASGRSRDARPPHVASPASAAALLR